MATVVTTPANPESVVWNEEETRFLRAVMSSEFLRTGENKQKTQASPPRTKARENEKPPVGEFRVLVIGAKGVGKTSILTRVSLVFYVVTSVLSHHCPPPLSLLPTRV
jgi:hypothetical protein